jgi:predicted RNase H-like HicB family nuclease
MSQFTLEYWEDEEWFVGRLVEVPGVFSQGETLEELKENTTDAYHLMIETEPLDFIPESRKRVPQFPSWIAWSRDAGRCKASAMEGQSSCGNECIHFHGNAAHASKRSCFVLCGSAAVCG